MMPRAVLFLALALPALATTSAAAKSVPVRPLIGLESGEGVTFTSSPSGGAISILYDKARVQVLAADPPVPGGMKKLVHRFRLVLGRPAQVLSFDLRGFRNGVTSDRTGLALAVGSKSVDLTPVLANDSFIVCVDFAVTGRTVDVIWTATARQNPGDEATLDLDSIDISAPKPGTRPQPLGKCKVKPA